MSRERNLRPGDERPTDGVRRVLDRQLVGHRSVLRADHSPVEASTPLTQTVWREGGRIRRTDGTGYSDRVSDEQIRAHINDSGSDALFVTFARAVLAIREFERMSEILTRRVDGVS